MGESASTESGSETETVAETEADAGTESDSNVGTAVNADADEDAYRGLFGAFPYSFRASSSWVFRSYVVVGGLLAALSTVLMVLALVVLLGGTANVAGGTVTLSRAFYVVVALAVIGPMLAPILAVARRHRLGRATGNRYDTGLSLSGYLFVISLYVGLVISVPAAQQETTSGALAPAVEALYALPGVVGFVPPVVAGAVMIVVHRLLR